jgi:hypothetical protein
MKTKHIGYWITWFTTVILAVIFLWPRKSILYRFVSYLTSIFRPVSYANRIDYYSYTLISLSVVLFLLLIIVVLWTKRLKGEFPLRRYQITKYTLISLTAIVAFNVFTLTYSYYFIFRGLNKTNSGIDSVKIK